MNAVTRPHVAPKTDATYLVVVRSADGELLHNLHINAGNHEIARDRAVERLREKGHVIPVGSVFDTGQVDDAGLPTKRRKQMEMAVEQVVTWRAPVRRGRAAP